MIEYKEIVSQLKYPGVSKCMSEIFDLTNIESLRYSYDLTASNYPKAKTDNDISH